MGGMHGFGIIEREELSYHHKWELRVHGISHVLAVPGGGRFSLESLEPAQYLELGYYERWLQGRINTLLAASAITQEELDAAVEKYLKNPTQALPADDPKRYEEALHVNAERRMKAGAEVEEEESFLQAEFSVGDWVIAKTIHPKGHTRLPRYVRGRRGKVITVYRPQKFQDDEPMSDQVGPQTMYAVRFDGKELWGKSAEVNSWVVLDMWEAYLEDKV